MNSVLIRLRTDRFIGHKFSISLSCHGVGQCHTTDFQLGWTRCQVDSKDVGRFFFRDVTLDFSLIDDLCCLKLRVVFCKYHVAYFFDVLQHVVFVAK